MASGIWASVGWAKAQHALETTTTTWYTKNGKPCNIPAPSSMPRYSAMPLLHIHMASALALNQQLLISNDVNDQHLLPNLLRLFSRQLDFAAELEGVNVSGVLNPRCDTSWACVLSQQSSHAGKMCDVAQIHSVPRKQGCCISSLLLSRNCCWPIAWLSCVIPENFSVQGLCLACSSIAQGTERAWAP